MPGTIDQKNLSYMTQIEDEVVTLLAEAWNRFLQLPEEHPMDRQEFATAIHQAQYLVLARSERRKLNLGPARPPWENTPPQPFTPPPQPYIVGDPPYPDGYTQVDCKSKL